MRSNRRADTGNRLAIGATGAPTDVRAALPDLVDAWQTAYVVLGARHCFLYANAAALTLLGQPREALIGSSFLEQFSPREQHAIAAHCDGRAGDAPAGWSTVHRYPGGVERAIEYVPRICEHDGQPLVAVTMREVTTVRQSVRIGAALAGVAASMTFAGSLRDILDGVARSVVRVTGIPACLVWLIEGEDQQLRVAGSHGLPEGFAAVLEQVWRDGAVLPSLQAYRSRQPLVIPNARQSLLADPDYASLKDLLQLVSWDSLACVPLVYHGAALGTLVGYYLQGSGPGEAELAFLSAVADQAAVAVESARLAVQIRAAAALEERRQAEVLLREKESQYRAIFETTTDGLIISTLDGIDVEANPAYCRIHGYSQEELRQLPADAYIHPEYRHVLEAYLRTVRAGGSFHAQSMHVRKDGTPFHVEVHGVPFSYHGVPHVLGIVRDITEQVQAYQTLEQRVEERTRELSLLLEVSHNMTSTLELQPLLGLILAQLKEVVDYREANILRLEGDDLVFQRYWGPVPEAIKVGKRFKISKAPANLQVIERREPVIIADTWDDSALARSFRKVGSEDLENSHLDIGSWIGVPLMRKEQVVGMLGLSHSEPHYYTPRHARLALAVANQAAVAIENARLYAEAQEIAALRERQRLARDLHDSVSQALYGIALGTHTARSLLGQHPDRAAAPIEYVLTLAEAGLAEMRALIFELRPESLEAEGLVAAINHQLAALSARHGIRVEATLGEEPNVPLNVKEAMYRIVQEALHNTVKHARASTARISLESNPAGLALELADDGVGFNVSGHYPGHLGLHGMQERAVGVGGTVEVLSAPGSGTKVVAILPRPS